MSSAASRCSAFSSWLAEALAAEGPASPEPLRQDIRADVCIVGGGFTGLWTAIEIKQARPDTEVVIVEARLCGSGASGRNGGFVLSLWAKFLSLAKMCGEAEALRLCQQSAQAIVDLQAFCQQHGIDAQLRLDGWLWAATTTAQLGSWDSTASQLERLGQSPFQRLAAGQAAQLSGSRLHLDGVYEPLAASIQPAMLARGLLRVARQLGVRVYESSPMQRLDAGMPARVQCREGSVRADKVVLAMNAWAVQFADIRKAFVVVSSDVVITRPLPALLQSIGWTNGMTISDSRMLVHYYRTTPDGRIVFGKGGGSEQLLYGAKLADKLDGASGIAATVAAHLRRTYPGVQADDIVGNWTGPIDRTRNGLPHFGALPQQPNVFYAIGYSGNGVGPSMLGGKILAALALSLDNEWARCGLVHGLQRDFPPEPFRYLGGRLIRHAVGQVDLAADENRQPSWLMQQLCKLAPSGLSPTKAATPSR
ncbi:FAD-dependent oxidoreductase [Aquitalea magnusonii]|uniref:Putative aminophosphonate oxidoreductase n=1 Tax=Aquitalea magnusonii TaxID=332411 RepID=A0A318J2Q1_9NEIS|nr:FAD-dependent oxidoreductase [Aquitalea magnusonii]PXX42832.1 putative aminophosphonate oxidoreductase [Aquitalea magnusonii]